MKSEAAPAPFDIELNGQGYMLGLGPQGEPLYSEEVRSTVQTGEKTKAYTGFPGGIGVHSESSSAVADRAAAFTYADTDAVNFSSTVGGGADIRFGPPIVGPEVVEHALGTGQAIRRLVQWQGNYYAASGHLVIKSTTPDFSSGTSTIATLDSDVVDLCGFAGSKSGPRLYIAQRYGPLYSWDGSTLSADGIGSDARSDGTIESVVKDVGGVLTDYTGASADLSSLPTANGYLYLGTLQPFIGAQFHLGDLNTTMCVVDAAYWNGSAWTATAITVDGTSSGGVSLALDGESIFWTRPAAAWAPLVLTEDRSAFYYIRLHWSANLDPSVTATIDVSDYRREADGFAVVSERLVISSNRERFYWTDEGGVQPLWNAAVRYAPPTADVVRVFNARGGAYIHRTDGLYTVDRDGHPEQVLIYDPPLPSRDGTPCTVWLDQAYLEVGLGQTVQFSPNPGGVASVLPMGMERLNMEDAAQQFPRLTSAAGDREHFLYATALDPSGALHLACWGTYRLIANPQTGVLEWARYDAWSTIAHLRTRVGDAMATWTHSDGKRWLMIGDSGGVVMAVRLPAGVAPIADPNYRYCTVADGIVRAPTFWGDDPARPVAVYGASVQGRGLAAGQYAKVQAVTPGTTTIVGTATFSASGRQALSAGYSGRGVDPRIVIGTSDATKTPVLDRVELHYQGVVRAVQRHIEATVLADDDVRDRNGIAVEYAASDWLAALDAATAATLPVALTRTDGSATSVLVQDRKDTQARKRETRSPARAVSLVLETSTGA